MDHLRSIDGTKVAAVIRDLSNRGRAARKASLRSSEGDIDVSAIARKQGEAATSAPPASRPTTICRPWSTSSAARSPQQLGA